MDINTQFPIKGIIVFYLLIVANFLAPLFNCRLQDVLINNMYLKHVFGFITLFFFVVFVEPEHSDKSFKYQLAMAVGIYLWFILTTRMEIHAFALFIVVLFLLYLFNIYYDKNNTAESEEEKKLIKERVNRYGLILGTTITAIGFTSYVGQKKIEYGNTFTWHKFFLGVSSCKGKSPNASKIETIANIPRFISKAVN
jgi:hypothetical protein